MFAPLRPEYDSPFMTGSTSAIPSQAIPEPAWMTFDKAPPYRPCEATLRNQPLNEAWFKQCTVQSFDNPFAVWSECGFVSLHNIKKEALDSALYIDYRPDLSCLIRTISFDSPTLIALVIFENIAAQAMPQEEATSHGWTRQCGRLNLDLPRVGINYFPDDDAKTARTSASDQPLGEDVESCWAVKQKEVTDLLTQYEELEPLGSLDDLEHAQMLEKKKAEILTVMNEASELRATYMAYLKELETGQQKQSVSTFSPGMTFT
jgi:hypothetical protein